MHTTKTSSIALAAVFAAMIASSSIAVPATRGFHLESPSTPTGFAFAESGGDKVKHQAQGIFMAYPDLFHDPIRHYSLLCDTLSKDGDGDKSSNLKSKYNQTCSSGTDFGCACEEETCPTEGSEKQPSCTASDCGGNNAKCTGGDSDGCECKQPECPDITKVSFFCSDCGGKGSDGKCRGDPEDGNIWVGCDCTDDPDWDSGPPPRKISRNAAAHRKALESIPDIAYPSTPSSTAVSAPSKSCSISNQPIF